MRRAIGPVGTSPRVVDPGPSPIQPAPASPPRPSDDGGWNDATARQLALRSAEPGFKHGFRAIEAEALPGGAQVLWFANDCARSLVLVSEAFSQGADDHMAELQAMGEPGPIVFIDPSSDATEASVVEQEAWAARLGAAQVHKLPVQQRGMGGAPEAPLGADVGLREAVVLAAEKLPPDVRAGALRRAEGFLAAEKV